MLILPDAWTWDFWVADRTARRGRIARRRLVDRGDTCGVSLDGEALDVQQPGTIGQYGVDEAVTALDGGTVAPKVQTGFTTITKDNVASDGAKAVSHSSC
jgi:hypothetical protein